VINRASGALAKPGPLRCLKHLPNAHTELLQSSLCSSPSPEHAGTRRVASPAGMPPNSAPRHRSAPHSRGQSGQEGTPQRASKAAASLPAFPSPHRVFKLLGALRRAAGGQARAGEVLRFPARPGRRHPQHPAAEPANPARLILFLGSFQFIKASRHPAEDSLLVSLEGKAGP